MDVISRQAAVCAVVCVAGRRTAGAPRPPPLLMSTAPPRLLCSAAWDVAMDTLECSGSTIRENTDAAVAAPARLTIHPPGRQPDACRYSLGDAGATM